MDNKYFQANVLKQTLKECICEFINLNYKLLLG